MTEVLASVRKKILNKWTRPLKESGTKRRCHKKGDGKSECNPTYIRYFSFYYRDVWF